YTSTPYFESSGSLPAELQPTVVTISAWYKATSVDGQGSEVVSASNRYGVRVYSSTQMKVFKKYNSSTWAEATATVSNPLDGNWHHIAGTITGTTMTCYFDGVAVGTPLSESNGIYYGTTGATLVGMDL